MPKINNQEVYNFYFNKNYSRFLEISKNITRRYKNNTILRDNLLHDVYLSIYNRLDKHYEMLQTELDFIKYTTKYLKQFFIWQRNLKQINRKDNSLFTYEGTYTETQNQIGSHKNKNYEILDIETIGNGITDNKAEKLIYLQAENTDDITKLFLEDLISNDIDIEKGLMVNKIKHVAKSLSLDEYQIFDMYYLQELNCLEIYNELKRTNTNYMSYLKIRTKQKEVRKKIIEKLK